MSLAVQFTEYGTPDVLRIVDVPPLTAGPGQVRLAVRAAGVNPIDWKILHGSMRQVMPVDLPGGLGSDVAGVVDQVGEGVTAFSVGDEVLGASITPSYAQSALADPAALVAKPASVPWEVAATLAGTGITAWEVLNKLKISTGRLCWSMPQPVAWARSLYSWPSPAVRVSSAPRANATMNSSALSVWNRSPMARAWSTAYERFPPRSRRGSRRLRSR